MTKFLGMVLLILLTIQLIKVVDKYDRERIITAQKAFVATAIQAYAKLLQDNDIKVVD